MTKNLLAKVWNFLNRRIFQSNLIVFLFGIIGILLFLTSIFARNELENPEEHSGILGYYIFFILYPLFGINTFFIGPILILLSLKSFLSSNLEYLKRGFMGLLLFLISSSSLLYFFYQRTDSFIGYHIGNMGIYLFGKSGFMVLNILLFVISLFYLFSLKVEDIKNWKINKNINFFSFLVYIFPFIISFLSLKNYFQKKSNQNKKSQDMQENTEKKEKLNLMDFFKKIFKESESSQKNKPPWIQKVEIEEDIKVNFHQKENFKSNLDHPIKEDIQHTVIQKENFLKENEIKQYSDKNQSNNLSFLNLDYYENQFPNSDFSDNSEDQEKESYQIVYDSQKNRFLFLRDSKKKTLFKIENGNIHSNSKNLLDNFDLDSEIYNTILLKQLKEKISFDSYNSNTDEYRSNNNQIEIDDEINKDIEWGKEYLSNNINIQNNRVPFETISLLEDGKNPEKPIKNTNLITENDKEDSEKEFLNQDISLSFPEQELSHNELLDQQTRQKEIVAENSLFSYSNENIQKKIQELQDLVISSEKMYKPYGLSISILKNPEKNFEVTGISIQKEIQENWQKLEQVLQDYGIKGQVVGATRGPMITMYEVRLEPGVRVNRILSLQDEICMNLAALSVRIVAPIPGKNTIGVEIPNKIREYVRFSELLHKDSEFFSKKRDINIPLGKDVSGKTRYIDLTRLPHLLIAGATGSGKSVFLNSIIASLLYQYSPEQIRFLMIDPKMVELKLYEGIPHLLYPVIIDVKLAEKALHWAVNEMENRYKLLSLTKCRDIRSYNEKIKKGVLKGNLIPYIVIFIDELSDLMMVAPKEVEESMIRLTQKARAVGIHMILATQRPSVDVITALIKANCPARISFQVAQKVDSRIILDLNGAETLLGKGDMLYRSPASTLPVRIQAPDITEEEIEEIVKETQKYEFYGYIELPQEEETTSDFSFSQMDEELIGKAWKIILETGKTSTSYVQRRLRIGYNRAANIMEKLEEMGYLSPAIGNKPREIIKRE